MTKKIMHLVYSMGCGGLEKVIVNLINASDDYDCEHIIVTLTEQHELIALINKPVSVYCVHKRPGKDLHCHLRLYRLFKQLSPEVLNTYNFGTIEYQLVAKLAGIKLRVHSDHGRGGDDAQGKNHRNNWIRRFMSRFIDKYIVVSQDLYEWVTRFIKIQSKEVHIIQNGVNLDEYGISDTRPNDYVFCTVGRLDEVKNQPLMLRAYRKALAQSEALSASKLVIAGDGPMREKLTALIQQEGLQDKVELLGYREDIAAILSCAHAFILSSHYEAMPMTILEAMATKIPVLTTDVGGIRHFISDDEAIFVPKGNEDEMAAKMIELFQQPAHYQQQITQAYNLVLNKYSLGQMTKSYMQTYGVI